MSPNVGVSRLTNPTYGALRSEFLLITKDKKNNKNCLKVSNIILPYFKISPQSDIR